MGNVAFAKISEKLRKGVDVKLISNEDSLIKWTSRPIFVKSTFISDISDVFIANIVYVK